MYPLATPPNSAGADTTVKIASPEEARASMWSDTQTSKPPTRPKRGQFSNRGTQRSKSTSRPRTQSFSTAENPHASHKQGPGAFKVVIDRPKLKDANPQQPVMHTLEVPIPHYRLGTPHFSARGTAFLHSSVFTGGSVNEDTRASVTSGPEYERLFPIPPGMDSRAALSRRHSHSSPEPFSGRVSPKNDVTANTAVPPTPTFHRSNEPITASIYDGVSASPDDPAIVRYSPNSGEITAATPARIIAQITSKTFLDYELLSDFFLTVRAYLSTHDLLAYLLARFEWAINRFDDDGRVIRVRAFAALRHWILNYFPYDFISDRELRVDFCQRLNALSKLVRERPKASSDVKLILDLKKCWNGRCALYWDVPLTEDDFRRDLDINPGGISGSRDSQLTHPSQLRDRPVNVTPPRIESSVDPDKAVTALNNWFDAVLEAGNTSSMGPERQISIVTSRSLPTSPTSEQSIQAMSCTIPGRNLKRLVAHPKEGFGAHPVPVAMVKRVCPAAPSAIASDAGSRPKHAHKRSGSFSDAFRDKRASLPCMQERSAQSSVLTFPHSGSLIRGSVVPPGSPYIDAFAPPSPTRELPAFAMHNLDDDSFEDLRNPYPLTPGMRNIFGSIRRALSSKQIHAMQSTNTLGYGFPVPLIPTGRPVNIPPKAAKILDGNPQQLEAVQKHTRIDLLCADVHEMFQRALQEMSQAQPQPLSSIGVASGNEREQPSPDHVQHPEGGHPEPLIRNHSATTYGSRSIVIVDDTGPKPPIPRVPPQFSTPVAPDKASIQRTEGSHKALPPSTQAVAETEAISHAPVAGPTMKGGLAEILGSLPPLAGIVGSRDEPNRPSFEADSQNSLANSPQRRGLSRAASGRSYIPNHSGSKSIRKYTSFQSGMPNDDWETTNASDAPWIQNDSDGPPQRRLLRRRPGGDLRANENVHDLEPILRPRSTGSIATFSDSMRGSELLRKRNTRGPSERKTSHGPPSIPSGVMSKADKQMSLVRTHSSQPALRPSFEAAVAEFARIPDDDGGDIEATLLKLEGKYRKSPVDGELGPPDQHGKGERSGSPRPSPDPSTQDTNAQPKRTTVIPATVSKKPPAQLETPNVANDENPVHRNNMARSLYAESEESYNSTPLLERGLSTKSKNRGKATANTTEVSVPRPLFSPSLDALENRSNPSLLSVDESQDQGSTRRTRYLSSIPTTTDSFLLDEDEFLSDLSSDISGEDDERDDGPYGSSAQLLQDRATTPTPRYTSGQLPSPPMTTENAAKIASHAQHFADQRKPPTPEPSPVNRIGNLPKTQTPDTLKTLVEQPLPTMTRNFMTRRHIPFVLSYDSKVLTEQFTIIEKDALNEINWQDLINMRWHHTSPSTQNWVEFLRTQDPTGIELVTARFNIVVKWALSEIVLTHGLEERAMCIMKYIHIAAHARRTHNYATMLQLTIALTSIDCSRLTKTWELVPAAEKATLAELETLVTPIKNFHNLRQEMETVNSDDGCIPVVAMYIHDLTYNSQKPSQIASTREGMPLVNFERYRTTASIVKSLLRLIDASAKYQLKPVEGAIERCLWMASLSDEMIRARSKELE